jgi:ferredoxin-NADP reductase
VYAVAKGASPSPSVHRGYIDVALIRCVVPDFLDRTFYISGPWAMVSRFRRVLKEMGVARSRIKVGFFPGFA